MKLGWFSAAVFPISYFVVAFREREILWWGEAGTAIATATQPYSPWSSHMSSITGRPLYVCSIFYTHCCALMQQFHYNFQFNSFLHSRLSLAPYISLPPLCSFVISRLAFPVSLFCPISLSHFLFGCLSTFSSRSHPSPTVLCRLAAGYRVRSGDDAYGERSRWRQGMPGWRQWRGPSASKGCHGNRLSQPVAAVLVNS